MRTTQSSGRLYCKCAKLCNTDEFKLVILQNDETKRDQVSNKLTTARFRLWVKKN